MNHENYKFRKIKGKIFYFSQEEWWDFNTFYVKSHLKIKIISKFANCICSKIVPIIIWETFFNNLKSGIMLSVLTHD